jgi:hypothetical protein
VAGFWAMFWRKKLQMAKTFNTGPWVNSMGLSQAF